MKLPALVLSLLISALSGATALAAEPRDDAEEPVTEETEQAAAVNEDDADAALEEEIRAADEQAASNATPTPAGRNESFIPTVQISEDLSVSFPVDI